MNAHLSFARFCAEVLRLRLTPAQLVWARGAIDGIDPAQLSRSDRRLAAKLFGPVETIPDEARHVVALLKGARVGGTWLCSLALLWLGLTADLSGLAPGEPAFGPMVAPDMRVARQPLRYIVGAVRSVPSLERLIVSSGADSLTLRRPDGIDIEFVALPASRGGAATRGRTLFGALMDESSFFRDPDSGIVNDSEVYRSLVVRVLPGGRLFVISTAWTESGLLWDLIQANHGHPATAVAAIAPTELMRTDSQRIAKVVADERIRDPQNAAREFDCQPFAQGAGFFFDPSAIRAAATDSPITLPPNPALPAAAGVDLGFRSDASAIVIVRRNGSHLEVAELLELRPSKGQPLQPSAVLDQFAAIAKRHGCRALVCDFHYLESTRELAREHGLYVMPAPGGLQGKVSTHTAARTALHEGRVRIAKGHKRLLAQLRELVSKPTPGGGLSITSPRRAGSHGDLASAWVLAVWAAARLGLSTRSYAEDSRRMRARLPKPRFHGESWSNAGGTDKRWRWIAN